MRGNNDLGIWIVADQDNMASTMAMYPKTGASEGSNYFAM